MDTLELKFYEFIEFKPVPLTACGFYNLQKFGAEVGNDVCYHMEDAISCDGCEQIQKVSNVLPILTADIYWELCILAVQYGNFVQSNRVEFKHQILNQLMQIDTEEHKQQIRDIIESRVSLTDCWLWEEVNLEYSNM